MADLTQELRTMPVTGIWSITIAMLGTLSPTAAPFPVSIDGNWLYEDSIIDLSMLEDTINQTIAAPLEAFRLLENSRQGIVREVSQRK